MRLRDVLFTILTEWRMLGGGVRAACAASGAAEGQRDGLQGQERAEGGWIAAAARRSGLGDASVRLSDSLGIARLLAAMSQEGTPSTVASEQWRLWLGYAVAVRGDEVMLTETHAHPPLTDQTHRQPPPTAALSVVRRLHAAVRPRLLARSAHTAALSRAGPRLVPDDGGCGAAAYGTPNGPDQGPGSPSPTQ